MRGWNVGIVGGGPGGLMTAYFLQNAANSPIRVTLFEAADRLGGKICTPRFECRSASYEAGAAEFYDYSPVGADPLKELIADLGLSISPIGGSAVILNHQILSNVDDVRDQLGKAACDELLAFDRVAKDWMSPHEYYQDGGGDCIGAPTPVKHFDSIMKRLRSPETRHYIENMIHSDLATEPERTSTSYGLQNYLMNDPRYMHLYCIEGGNQKLPEELIRRISATYRMNHRVTDIGRGSDGKMTITSDHEGVKHEEAFDFVVVALPNNYLPKVRFRGERLAAAIKAHHEHYNHPAHYLRMTLLFDRPFWRSKVSDSFFMLDEFGGCCLYDESARDPEVEHGVLGWLLGGQTALEMSAMEDDALIAAALDSLPDQLAEGREYFLEGRVHRWVNAVNAMPGGSTPRGPSQRHQPEPTEHPDLFVVGDYLFDSTLNGVLDSADFVAEWLASRMLEN